MIVKRYRVKHEQSKSGHKDATRRHKIMGTFGIRTNDAVAVLKAHRAHQGKDLPEYKRPRFAIPQDWRSEVRWGGKKPSKAHRSCGTTPTEDEERQARCKLHVKLVTS